MPTARPNTGAADAALERARSPGRMLRWTAIVLSAGLFSGLLFAWLSELRPATDYARLLLLAAWALIALFVVGRRFSPRPWVANAATMQPRVEAFQAKRWRLILICAAYLLFILAPMTALECLALTAKTSLVDRLVYAVTLIAPCLVVIALMYGAMQSRALQEAADDELTRANRARALAVGFAVLVGAAAIAFVTDLLRPEWALASVAPVICAGVATAGARFALLERDAAQAA